MEQLEKQKLINFEKPERSLLRTKALGQDKHGGGVKFPVDGQTDRQWNTFLKDYAAIRNARYSKSADIPKLATIRTWRTGLHLKIKDLPSLTPDQYAVVRLHRVDTSGIVAKEATAIGEGRVSKDGSSWSTTLMLIEPVASRHKKSPADWSQLLPDGKYQLLWLPVDSTLPLERVLKLPATALLNVDSLWKPGHSSAMSISFDALRSARN